MYTSLWPILNGDCVAGVSLHQIDAGIDTGDVIVQKPLKLISVAPMIFIKNTLKMQLNYLMKI